MSKMIDITVDAGVGGRGGVVRARKVLAGPHGSTGRVWAVRTRLGWTAADGTVLGYSCTPGCFGVPIGGVPESVMRRVRREIARAVASEVTS